MEKKKENRNEIEKDFSALFEKLVFSFRFSSIALLFVSNDLLPGICYLVLGEYVCM